MSSQGNIIHLEAGEIENYIRNRPPLFMLDSVDVLPGKWAKGYKYITDKEWYFACHFPGNPIMPGVMQMETLFQTGILSVKTISGNQYKLSNIAKVKDLSFKEHVLPDSELVAETELHSYKRGVAKVSGVLKANGAVVCTAEYILVIPEDMIITAR